MTPEVEARRLSGEVATMPSVRRNSNDVVTAFEVDLKVPFKGTVHVTAYGDLASAYWSITPGMMVAVSAVETGEKEYRLEGLDILG